MNSHLSPLLNEVLSSLGLWAVLGGGDTGEKIRESYKAPRHTANYQAFSSELGMRQFFSFATTITRQCNRDEVTSKRQKKEQCQGLGV